MRRLAVLATLLLSMAGAANASERVERARDQRMAEVRELFSAAGVSYPPRQVYLRAFKLDRELELWAAGVGEALKKVTVFPLCATSGELGPKRRQGDLQIPEGFYRVDRFNPWSNFHLSLGLDYPNASDRVLGDRAHPGGNIFIHGGCATIGCLPIEDGPIELLYLALLDAKRAGARVIPVHVFPTRLEDEALARLAPYGAERVAFWSQLQPAYLEFERTRRVPRISIDRKSGAYRVHRFR